MGTKREKEQEDESRTSRAGGSETLRRQVWIQCYTTTLSNFIKCQSDAAAAAHSRHFLEVPSAPIDDLLQAEVI